MLQDLAVEDKDLEIKSLHILITKQVQEMTARQILAAEAVVEETLDRLRAEVAAQVS